MTRVEVFYNDARGQFGIGFDPDGAELRKAGEFNLDLKGHDVFCDAEEVWTLLGNNPDATKPAGFEDRSVSVGDLLRIFYRDEANDEPLVMACEPVGFVALTYPPDRYAAVMRACDEALPTTCVLSEVKRQNAKRYPVTKEARCGQQETY